MNSISRTPRWLVNAVGVLSALGFIVLGLLLLMNLNQQRRARVLLETLGHFQLGKTRSVEAVKLARNFDFDTEISAWVDEPKQSRMSFDQLSECETSACSINIVLFLPGQYVGKDWFPRNGVVLSRYLPQKMVFTRIGVKKGGRHSCIRSRGNARRQAFLRVCKCDVFE